MNIRERLLSQPAVFQAVKWLTLPRGGLEHIIADHLHVEDGSSVLDFGCGYGDYAAVIGNRCRYVGIDHNPRYIELAHAKNTGNDAVFFVADVADPVVLDHGPYDLIMMSGVLHHLSSDVVAALAPVISGLLSRGGRFVAIEPVFTADQRLSARLVIASDRGRHVRDEDGYRQLLAAQFDSVETTIVSGMLRIPYTHVVISAQN